MKHEGGRVRHSDTGKGKHPRGSNQPRKQKYNRGTGKKKEVCLCGSFRVSNGGNSPLIAQEGISRRY